jgi:hypothetical protein
LVLVLLIGLGAVVRTLRAAQSDLACVRVWYGTLTDKGALLVNPALNEVDPLPAVEGDWYLPWPGLDEYPAPTNYAISLYYSDAVYFGGGSLYLGIAGEDRIRLINIGEIMQSAWSPTDPQFAYLAIRQLTLNQPFGT